jgi:stage V sporulation protein R
MMAKPLITSRTDWSQELIEEVYEHIAEVGLNDLKLDVYPNQIEVISSEQMIDAYASVGLPVHYHHWSFGKSFLKDWNKYQKGQSGLAYEIVINSNPCINYLMEENNAITQALVIAHAAFGHNHVFKNNYLFKDWTEASSIIDYMIFAKNYIRDCEEKYGTDEVEMVLDAAHTISAHGVDKRRRKHKKKLTEEQLSMEAAKKFDEEQKNMDYIMKRTTIKQEVVEKEEDDSFVGDEENLLHFIYKKAPGMETWKREILRIVYKVRQYFYPQGQTKTLNEGFATHTHYYIMNELERKGIISSDAQLAWLHLHSNVIYQPEFGDKYFDGSFNPYALGFSIFKEIRRICETPTAEDREWFPNLVGKDWREEQKKAVANYRDESFIAQFMSPHLMRKLKLFSVDAIPGLGVVNEISDERGYENLRAQLAGQYNTINYIPEIVVRSAAMTKNRELVLEYRPFRNRELHRKFRKEVLQHIHYLWGYPVSLIQIGESGKEELIDYVS